MNEIDIDFDFCQDSKSGDPDADSPKLYMLHSILWTKTLPIGMMFNLEMARINGKLFVKSNLCGNLSSDRMCPHFDGACKGKFNGWLSEIEIEELKHKVRTIGGHIVFPAHQKNGQTINQARGMEPKVRDRFDLTLECIRLFYQGQSSPLYDTLKRYISFFDLFIDFNGYISFFLLQDFIDGNGRINFSLPLNDFNRSPLPQTVDEYKSYKTYTIDLINRRNKRILKSLLQR